MCLLPRLRRDGGCRVVVAGGDVVGAIGRGGVAGRLDRGDGVFACRSVEYFAAGGRPRNDCYAERGQQCDTSNTAQLAQDQNILSSLTESATSSGCIGTGASARTVRTGRANWAELLKTNPNLATVISSSYDMGIVNLLPSQPVTRQH
jgi:hypothetical protein